MSLPASFSNNTSPTGVQLDQNFAAVGFMGVTLCTATGTNSITLTPNSNQPAVSAYTNQQLFDFQAAASSNGSVTVQVGSLAALPLYLIGGSQAGSGDVTNGTPYIIQYLTTLNSGGGGFQILSNVPSSAAVAVAPARTQGLLMFNNSGTPNTKIDITAGYTVLSTTGGTPKFLSSVSVTIDLTTTGANGMDTGSRPTSGYVYCYIINNGSVTAGLATATSPTAGTPTFPNGYSNFAYVGAMFCDGSQNLFRCRQTGQQTQYTLVAATNTANYPLFGFSSGTTLCPLAVGSLAPTLVARELSFLGVGSTSNTFIAVGPNSTASAAASGTPFPAFAASSPSGIAGYISGRMLLESGTIYCGAAAGSIGVYAVGWRDQWSAG